MADTLPPEEILDTLLSHCKRAGADGVDARLSRSAGLSTDIRLGKLESIERDESQSVSLRCLFGQRQAHVSGADFSMDALEVLADRCVAMARMAPEDPFCALAESEALATDWPDLDVAGENAPELEALEAEAQECEANARAVDGVTDISYCSAGWSQSQHWLVSSSGFQAHLIGGSSGVGVMAVARADDGSMESDYESWNTRWRDQRPSADRIGKVAGQRAIARLNARKIDSQTAPVIYENRLASGLISSFISAISGTAIARGVSFLKDKMDQPVFATGIDIIDDPLKPRSIGARGFDGEGRTVSQTKLIDNGRLTCWMLNGPAARQLGLEPNGFASLAFGDPPGISGSNISLSTGEADLAGLMEQADKGLLVTDMFSPSINPNTGDYSAGISGFWFENGEIVYPVNEATIAGDLISMFARLQPGSDIEYRGSINAPSLLIDGLTIAGR